MTAPRILVFYPSNQRTVQIETTILAIHARGVAIELLTTCEPGPLHAFLRAQGVPVHTHAIAKRPAALYYARQIWHLVRFCRKGGFTAVFSNLQHANLIAAFAQYFVPARVVLFRHHFKFVFPGEAIPLERNRMEMTFDRVINHLGRTIVVPSTGVYNGMRDTERADLSRVMVLPYIYYFEQYGQPDTEAVAAIRSRFPARLTLLMSARLIPFKRHDLVFPVVRRLVEEGLDVRLFVLGDGPERERLDEYVRAARLEERIVMLGFRTDFLDYMAASDLLVHPSLTEASSNVVKEMALLGETALVCSGVGDFDDYIEHGRNGFLVPRTTDGSEIADILREVHRAPEALEAMGSALRAAVLERFSVTPERVARYLELANR